MTKYERAAQLWSVLALAARNRQILTYDIAARLTGLPRPGVGPMLAPIQDYCVKHQLPPLTILVVSEASGLPGEGFIAAEDIPRNQALVFGYDWHTHGAPSPAEFEASDGEARNS